MPRASFGFGPANTHTMVVVFRWWGQESYFIDGQLAHKRWSVSLAGSREFKVGDQAVRIDVSAGPKEYFTRVFVDGKLHVAELFPEVKARVEKWKRPPRSYILQFVVALVGAALVVWLASIWNASRLGQ